MTLYRNDSSFDSTSRKFKIFPRSVKDLLGNAKNVDAKLRMKYYLNFWICITQRTPANQTVLMNFLVLFLVIFQFTLVNSLKNIENCPLKMNHQRLQKTCKLCYHVSKTKNFNQRVQLACATLSRYHCCHKTTTKSVSKLKLLLLRPLI